MRTMLLALAFAIGCTPPTSWAITGGQLLDVERGEVRENGVVVVEDGVIREILPPGSAVPDGLEIVNATGLTLTPGLWDNHAHMLEQDENGSLGALAIGWELHRNVRYKREAHIQHGVTSLRDPAGSSDLHALRERLQRGEVDGPRFFTGGKFFTAVGGHPIPSVLPPYIGYRVAYQVGNDEDVVAGIEESIELGVDFLHVIYTSAILKDGEFPANGPRIAQLPKFWFNEVPIIPEPVLGTIVEEAAARGYLVSAHVDRFSEAREALEAGVFYLEHSWIVPDDDEGDAFFADMVARDVCWDPTLVVYFSRAPEISPPRVDAVRRANEAGVRITVGTDAGEDGALIDFGRAVHVEMRLLEDAGLSAHEVWRAATLTSAECMRVDDVTGSISVGKEADILLIAGDPFNFNALSPASIRDVFVAGRRLKHR